MGANTDTPEKSVVTSEIVDAHRIALGQLSAVETLARLCPAQDHRRVAVAAFNASL